MPRICSCHPRRDRTDRGQEAVEAGAAVTPRVLGLIHDPGPLVRRRGLVRETPHRRERLAVRRVARLPVDGHLEHVPVRLRERGRGVVRPGDRLLATEPAATAQPVSAGAVHRGAGERHEAPHERAGPRVVVQRGRATAGELVVRARSGRDAASARGVAVLVVADQPHRPARAAERRHPVESERRQVPVRHLRADVAERHVGEPGRQLEDEAAVLIRGSNGHAVPDRPVAARFASAVRLARRPSAS